MFAGADHMADPTLSPFRFFSSYLTCALLSGEGEPEMCLALVPFWDMINHSNGKVGRP
jgi:hypothetical protein